MGRRKDEEPIPTQSEQERAKFLNQHGRTVTDLRRRAYDASIYSQYSSALGTGIDLLDTQPSMYEISSPRDAYAVFGVSFGAILDQFRGVDPHRNADLILKTNEEAETIYVGIEGAGFTSMITFPKGTRFTQIEVDQHMIILVKNLQAQLDEYVKNLQPTQEESDILRIEEQLYLAVTRTQKIRE
jgi:hypothetical protein